MNWQQGLFRVWVLFSAVWIIGFAIYAAANWGMLVSTNTYEITGPNGHEYKFTGPSGASREDVIAFAQQSDIDRQPTLHRIEVALRAADAARNTQEARRLAATYAKVRDEPLLMPDSRNPWALAYWAIGVPLLIFGMGLAIRWIISGFRHRAPE